MATAAAVVVAAGVYAIFASHRRSAEEQRIASELLANPVIQRAIVRPREEWLGAPPDLDVPRVSDHTVPPVATVAVSSPWPME